MTVLGFMPRTEIRRQLLLGDGAMTFQPVEDDENSATALSALAFALLDLEMAAVVRRVFREEEEALPDAVGRYNQGYWRSRIRIKRDFVRKCG